MDPDMILAGLRSDWADLKGGNTLPTQEYDTIVLLLY